MSKNNPVHSLCHLEELNLSCFGCCGRRFAGKTILKRDIRINTKRYHERKYDIDELKSKSKEIRSSGICKFIIYLEDSFVGCPLHPSQNNGCELRKDHCDIDYICETQRHFANWDSDKQKIFIEYIKNKNLDFVDFSRGMALGSFLRGFKLKYSL